MTVRIITGDAARELPALDRAWFHAVVTSPPYFGQRDYAVPPTEWPAVRYAPMVGLPDVEIPAMRCALGLEPTVEAYVGHLVLLFREVRRTLRADATLWLNVGDSYAGDGGRRIRPVGRTSQRRHRKNTAVQQEGGGVPGFRRKELLGVPWRVAFALGADGWLLRQEVVWAKANCTPERVEDRPTRAHEQVFLFATQRHYFYDWWAVSRPVASATGTDAPTPAGEGRSERGYPGTAGRGGGRLGSNDRRNARSVWPLATQPFSGAHYATMPPRLAGRCLGAATSARGACPACGAPWRRVFRRALHPSTRRSQGRQARQRFEAAGLTAAHARAIRAVGLTDTARGARLSSHGGGGTYRRCGRWRPRPRRCSAATTANTSRRRAARPGGGPGARATPAPRCRAGCSIRSGGRAQQLSPPTGSGSTPC